VPILLQAEKIAKRFSGDVAVDHIDLSIEKGCCFGLLGPNGAGKTTTLEMLEGVQLPDSGKIHFEGVPISRSFREQIGIQFQQTALPDHLTGRECLKLFASFYKKPSSIASLIKLCNLETFCDQPHYHLSGGQRQLLLLALSLVNNPKLLFLDEPTAGLDPVARQQFWQLVRRLKHAGKTIIITTHYMDEAEHLCDRIAIMDKGRVIAEGSPEALVRHHFKSYIATLPAAANDEAAAKNDLTNIGNVVTMECDSAEQLMAELTKKGSGIEALNVRKPNLDDLFLKLTGNSLLP